MPIARSNKPIVHTCTHDSQHRHYYKIKALIGEMKNSKLKNANERIKNSNFLPLKKMYTQNSQKQVERKKIWKKNINCSSFKSDEQKVHVAHFCHLFLYQQKYRIRRQCRKTKKTIDHTPSDWIICVEAAPIFSASKSPAFQSTFGSRTTLTQNTTRRTKTDTFETRPSRYPLLLLRFTSLESRP